MDKALTASDHRKWDDRIAAAKDARTLWETQVSTCSHFAAGIQNVWWDAQGNMRRKNVLPNEIFRIINLFPVYLNIIQSRLTANDPMWNPARAPGAKQTVSLQEKHAANALLQSVWNANDRGDLGTKRLMKLAIRRGYLEGGAIAYNRFDESTDMPVVDLFSMWDTYADTSAEDIYNKNHICFILPKSVEWVNNQKGWSADAKNVEADGIMSESTLKKEFMQNKAGGRTGWQRGTVNLRFCFEHGSQGLRYSIIGEDKELFAMDLPQYTSLCDLFTKFSPIDTGDFYTRPPCMDWVDLQKGVNKIYSSIECYIDTFGQGKWILENQNVTVPIAGVHGQKIYANNGEVQQLEMQPLPQTHFQHLNQILTQFEQVTGVHSESLGRTSGSADSGKAIAQLQALDEQNSSDAVDNFKLFLGKVGQNVLRDASVHWSDVKNLYHYDQMTGKQQPMKVVGSRVYDQMDDDMKQDSVPLRPFEQLNVEIVIGQYFHESQRRKELIDLLNVWQPGQNRVQDKVLLPIIMDSFDIGVGQDIVDELKKMENPDQMIAEGKVMKIADGEQVIVNANDPHEYLANYYTQRAQEYLQGGDAQAADALKAQASIHSTFLQQKGGPVSPDAPESLDQAQTQMSALGGSAPVATPISAGAPPAPAPMPMPMR